LQKKAIEMAPGLKPIKKSIKRRTYLHRHLLRAFGSEIAVASNGIHYDTRTGGRGCYGITVYVSARIKLPLSLVDENGGRVKAGDSVLHPDE
jgi:hypothetical protein